MKLLRFCVIMFFSVAINILCSQTLTQTIRGTVIDADSKQPLIGANIILLTKQYLGATSDGEGNFTLDDVPVGRHKVMVSYIGYQDKIISELVLGSAKQLVLKIELNEAAVQIDDVVVTSIMQKGKPNNDLAIVSAKAFTAEETGRFPSGLNDPGRMALSFAGVSVGEDTRNEIIIRGNSPNSILWSIEGMEVPPPNHFYEEGVSTGAISMISANLLERSDFFTGAFPSAYGNALSGVFDIALRNGNNQKHEYTFQFGALGTDLAAEGPFSINYNGSYLINYRYSTLSILNKFGISVPGDFVPEYQDLSYKLYLPTESFGIFSVWGIGGISSANLYAEKDSTEWEFNSDRENDISEMSMITAGFSNFLTLGKTGYLKSSFAFSYSESIDENSYLDNKYTSIPEEYDIVRNKILRGSVLYNKKLNAHFTFQIGLKINHLIFNHKYDNYISGRLNLQDNGLTNTVQLFTHAKYRLFTELAITGGIHVYRFPLSDEIIWEPRGGVRWDVSPDQSLSFGFGYHSRHEFLGVYFNRVYDDKNSSNYINKNLKLSKAVHLVLCYENYLRNDLFLKTEFYYQFLTDLIIQNERPFFESPINNIFDHEVYSNDGIGRNYGIEVSMEKYFSNNYYFLVNTSFYNAEVKRAGGKWFNSRFNGHFANNLVAGKEFYVDSENNDFIGANFKLIWSGGMRGPIMDNPYDRFGSQYKDYLRLDLNISYNLNSSKVRHIFSLNLQNVTNHQNIFEKEYEVRNGQTKEKIIYQTGLLPTFNYRVEF